jgi:hypothetical protein
MNIFKEKWGNLAPVGFSGGRFRVFPDHPLGFFLDYSLDHRREIVIEVLSDSIADFELPPFENIETSQTRFSMGLRIALVLNNDELVETFSVMCYDLAARSQSALGANDALNIFLRALNNWSDLLRQRRLGGMTRSEALGLFGELLVVEALFREGIDKTTVIEGWRGPHGDARDIGFNRGRIEVKTRHSTRALALKISSLDQLDDSGHILHIVLNLVSPSQKGLSLMSLTAKVYDELAVIPAARAEFERKLELSGFDLSAAVCKERFLVDERIVYEVRAGFPRLNRSSVPYGVVEANYVIAGPVLDNYRTTWDRLVEDMS